MDVSYTLAISFGIVCILSPPASALDAKRFVVEGAVGPYGDGQYEYIHPRADAVHVSELTSIAVREGDEVISGNLADLFDVTGEKSGHVTGRVVLARDNKTVIFYADQPFAQREKVSVKFGPGLRVRRPTKGTRYRVGEYTWQFQIRRQFERKFKEQEGAKGEEKGTAPMDRYRTLPSWAARVRPSSESKKAALDKRNAIGGQGDLCFLGVGHGRGEHAGQHISITREGDLVWWTHTSTAQAGMLGVTPTGHVAVWDRRSEHASREAFELNSTYQAVARHSPGHGYELDSHSIFFDDGNTILAALTRANGIIHNGETLRSFRVHVFPFFFVCSGAGSAALPTSTAQPHAAAPRCCSGLPAPSPPS